MSENDLQTLLKIEFINQKTKQKYSDIFITSSSPRSKECSYVTVYTFDGRPIVIDLLSMTKMRNIEDEIEKVNVLRIANEKEAKKFLNDFLNNRWNVDFKKELSPRELRWQSYDRKREFENEYKLYLCKLGKTYKFLDENEKVVVGEIVATKTVRFGCLDTIHNCYERMTGLQLKMLVDLPFLPIRTCVHCVSINYDENFTEPFFKNRKHKLLDNDEVLRVRDEPMVKATVVDDIMDLTEEYIVDPAKILPDKGKCYYYVVQDGEKLFGGRGFFDKEAFGLYVFHNAYGTFYVNPNNIKTLKEVQYEPVLKKLNLSDRIKIINRRGETFFGTGASSSVDEDGYEIITLANGQFNDKLSNVTFIYTRNLDDKEWKLVWHK